jgi:exopolysaccharide production protein ExoQ
MNSSSRADPISLWENALVVLVLLVSTGAFMNLGGDPENQAMDPGRGLWFMQAFWTCVYLATVRLLLLHCRPFLRILILQWPLMLLLGLAFVSICWSFQPAITSRKATALAMSALFGAYLAMRHSLREQLRLLAWTCAMIITLSFVFGLFGIGTPVNGPDSGWFGVFVHRNALGRMMVFSTIVLVVFSRVYKEWKLQASLGILSSLVLLLLSTSKGSIIYLTILLCLFLLLPGLRGKWSKVLGIVMCGSISGIAVLYLVITHFDAFTAMLGRDTNMTGRIPMWIASAIMALQRPWLGYGYSAFWLGTEGPSIGVWRLMDWEAPHAHNGLLNLWLDLGLVGVGVFLTGFFLSVRRAFHNLRAEATPEAVWPFMFLAFFFVTNLTESSMVDGNTIFWIMYVAVFMSLAPKISKVAVSARVSVRRRTPMLATVKAMPRP